MMSENAITLKRLDYIDVAKAIGIIAVMMSHSIGFPYNTGYYFTASYMALFFVLSGYTYKDGRTVKGNIVRRTVKMGKAYFFYSACLYIMTVASKIVLHSGLTKDYLLTAASGILYSTHSLYYPRTVEPNISFFLVQNAPLWYLTCFIVAGGLFDIAFNIAKNHRGGVFGIILTGTMATYLLANIPVRLPWGIDTAFAGMAFMAFGYCIRYNNLFQKNNFYWIIPAVFAVYIGFCNWNPGIAMSVREYGNHGVLSSIAFIVIGCTGALLYITFARILCKITYVKKVLCCTGRKTLPILAFHVFIFMVWDTIQERVLQKMGTTSLNGILYWSTGILKIAVTVMICIAGSWCWNTLKEIMKGKKDYGAKTI